MPGKPISTSSIPTRDRIATPFHCEWPTCATSYPRALNIISGNWSSRHLVSCRATTSTSLRSSQAATRSARLRMEFTFQVARRTGDHATSDLDGDLTLGGHTGAHPLPVVDELRRLLVEAGQERAQPLAGLLALGAEVGAVEHLPGAQDGADHLVVVQPR